MKIGIVLDDSNVGKIDCSKIFEGNPGIGGTLYEELLLAESLVLYSNHECVLYSTNKNLILSERISRIHVENIEKIPNRVKKDNIDILVFTTGKKLSWYNRILSLDIPLVAWAHCFINYFELRQLKKFNNIKKVVFVGKTQYLSYFADDIFSKSTYIYNMFDGSKSEKRKNIINNKVCYLGALNRYKGFHVLARAWPKILEAIPNAELIVLGKGNLYDNKKKLGSYEISDVKYEKSFIKYLLDKNSKILPSVHFLGNVGKEKSKIISSCSVGVVNPTGVTETFCISAIEIESCGLPVCTAGKDGLYDTVKERIHGLYSKNYQQLAANIIELLKDKDLNFQLGKNGIKNSESYYPQLIIKDWINLFDNIKEYDTNVNDKNMHVNEDLKLIPYLKILLFYIRKKIGLKLCPSLIFFDYFCHGMGRVFFRDIFYHITGKDR
ncbi:MAG: glycosyltransferase family 4 protein [Succinivibrio sp.]|nr:glycosyltransferase family 4 protein [Succinivibrio sp.]